VTLKSNRISLLSVLAVAVSAAALTLGPVVAAQKQTPADAAQALTGTWVLNKELSKGFSTPGARPGGPGRGALFAVAPAFAQGRGGGQGANAPSDMSPAELADIAAMRQLQQIAEVITIAASADRVQFTDARGERQYALDGKNVRLDFPGAEVTVKSRWDKAVIKQEFSTAQTKLTQTWTVDENGRLVLVAKVESLRLRTPDQRAVFDRRP
jgi:hypothetical protein